MWQNHLKKCEKQTMFPHFENKLWTRLPRADFYASPTSILRQTIFVKQSWTYKLKRTLSPTFGFFLKTEKWFKIVQRKIWGETILAKTRELTDFFQNFLEKIHFLSCSSVNRILLVSRKKLGKTFSWERNATL